MGSSDDDDPPFVPQSVIWDVIGDQMRGAATKFELAGDDINAVESAILVVNHTRRFEIRIAPDGAMEAVCRRLDDPEAPEYGYNVDSPAKYRKLAQMLRMEAGLPRQSGGVGGGARPQ